MGYSNIKNFQTLCLTFPDHSPTQLQTLFEQCGNDFEKTIDKILMSKWYNEPSANEYPVSNEPTTYTNNNNNHNHNHNHNNSNDYPNVKEEDDSRSSFANCHYNQPNQRMMTTPTFHNQDYAGEEMVNRAQPINSPNAMAPGSEWNYVDTSRYSSNYQNTWTQGEYSNWPNNSNFWNNNGHSYSYPEQNASNMGYFYGRRDMEYQDPGHLDRVQRPEIGSNISSNFDFDSY